MNYSFVSLKGIGGRWRNWRKVGTFHPQMCWGLFINYTKIQGDQSFIHSKDEFS